VGKVQNQRLSEWTSSTRTWIENTREGIEAGVFCDRTHIGPAPKQMPSPAEADIAPSRWAATDGRDPQPRAAVRMNEGNGFDELIHPATKLSIVALLAAADAADFAFVRDKLGLSDSALSKQLSTLEEAGYVTIDRPLSRRRRRVRARLTPLGRPRFAGHVAALREIIAAFAKND
jgi:DNA-binding transcriptional ArsR family regulator